MIDEILPATLIFSRLGGLLMAMPALGARTIPGPARLVAALPLTLMLLPAAAGAPLPETLSDLLAGIGTELLLGVAMGMVISLFFSALASGAEIISAQSGLHIATLLDPLTSAQPGALGVLATWLGLGVFLGTGLHLDCLVALGESLRAVPPGSIADAGRAGATLLPLAGTTLATAVQLAGPLTVFVFSVNLGLSLVGRMAPGLHVFFAIGPTLTVVAGLVVLGMALPTLLAAWEATFALAFDAIHQLLRAAG